MSKLFDQDKLCAKLRQLYSKQYTWAMDITFLWKKTLFKN